MTGRRFIDTNVLLYSISRDPAEERKRARAVALLQEDDLALSVQVLQEFYVQATRGNRPDPLPHDLAADLIRTWMRFPVQEATVLVHEAALEIEAAHGLVYWDSAIVAAAQALGCQELHTEDLGHGRQIGGVTVVNPFR
jgi:predicted nucleic acid-binding protein